MVATKILLVEGSDDEHVLKRLCGNRGGPQIDEVKPLGGASSLLESFPVRLKASQHGDILGLVIDADTDVNARWQSLRDRLVEANYPNVPATPSPDGIVLDPPQGTLLPRVGIWIMPDNQSHGILEDFLRFLIPTGSPLFDHVQSSVSTIPPGEVRFSQADMSKAVIHTWLAWQEEPGRPLGTAITARYLDPRVPQVDALISWLNRLYFP